MEGDALVIAISLVAADFLGVPAPRHRRAPRAAISQLIGRRGARRRGGHGRRARGTVLYPLLFHLLQLPAHRCKSREMSLSSRDEWVEGEEV